MIVIPKKKLALALPMCIHRNHKMGPAILLTNIQPNTTRLKRRSVRRIEDNYKFADITHQDIERKDGWIDRLI